MIKKIISLLVLNCLLVQSSGFASETITDIIENDSYISPYTTDVFEGNPMYLIQDHFDTLKSTEISGVINHAVSGWEIDYRGGRVLNSTEGLMLLDGDDENRISASRNFMKHSTGKMVFETAFKLTDSLKTGFYYTISDEDDAVIKLVCENKKLFIAEKDSNTFLAELTDDFSRLKIEIYPDKNKFKVSVNGQLPVESEFLVTTYSVSRVEISTGIDEDCYAVVKYVNLYVNYILNENFDDVNAGQLSYGWISNGATVFADKGSDYASNIQVLMLENSMQNHMVYAQKSFESLSSAEINFKIFISGDAEGTYIKLKNSEDTALTLFASDTAFKLNNEIVYDNYTKNLWYSFKLKLNGADDSCTLYINGKEIEMNIPFTGNNINMIELGKDSSVNFGTVKFDEIEIYKPQVEYNNYPTAPIKAESTDFEIGVTMYSMWREGNHYGWDTISPYSDKRKPYLGYYSEGSAEVSDWENKWLIEHGVDYEIYPFVRQADSAGYPIKDARRSEALMDGYFKSKYSNLIDFAIMYSGVSADNLSGLDDFINNVLPYWVEYYFKDSRYKVIGNKPILYLYGFSTLVSVLGSNENTLSAISALNEAVKELGYDGVIIAASGMSDELSAVFPDIYRWRYDWATDNADYHIACIKSEDESTYNHVTTISQGYDTTPWRNSNRGMICPEEYDEICKYVLDRTEALKKTKPESAELITLDCWNEYGEGHYIAPSTLSGFDYLDCIKRNFTSANQCQSESLPDDKAIARMNALYPTGRGTLKLADDMISYTEDEIAQMTQINKMELTSDEYMSRWSNGKCNISYDSENEAIVGKSIADDAKIYVDFSSDEIDMSMVKAIKINCFASGAGSITAYYTTDTDANVTSDKSFFACLGKSDEYKDYILVPTAKSELTGKLKTLRIDFDDNHYKTGGTFGIKSIEFLGGNIKYSVELNGEKVTLSSDIIADGENIMIPAYKFYLSYIGAKVIWDLPEKTLTVVKDGNIAEFTANSSCYKLNGTEKKCTAVPIYTEGNIYISYLDILKDFGYETALEEEIRKITFSETSLSEYKPNSNFPYSWNFNTASLEGWSCSPSKVAKIKTKDGYLRISAHTDDPIITKRDISIPTSEYNYLLLKLKNTTPSTKTTVRFNDAFAVDISTKTSNEFCEYLIDLSQYSEWKGLGNVTSIRIDPCEAVGVTYIDRIELLKSKSYIDFSLDASNCEWEDILPEVTAANTEYFTFTNVADYTSPEIPFANDGSIILKAEDLNSNTLFGAVSVNYNGKKNKLNSLCDDNSMIRLEFSYRTDAESFGSFNVVNRLSSGGNQVTIDSLVPSAQWQKFSTLIDMSECYDHDSTKNRWIVITLPKKTAGTLYIKDFNICCAKKGASTQTVTSDNLILTQKTINNTSESLNCESTLLVVKYLNEKLIDISIINNAALVPPGETAEKVFFCSVDNSDRIDAFLWSGLETLVPLTEKISLNIERNVE